MLVALRIMRFNGQDLAAGDMIPRLASAQQERRLISARYFRLATPAEMEQAAAVAPKPDPVIPQDDVVSDGNDGDTDDGAGQSSVSDLIAALHTHADLDAFLVDNEFEEPEGWERMKVADKKEALVTLLAG